MKNNEWNIPSDYFEKNKKALMPVRKFPTGKWLLALAAACVIGVGFFMWKGNDRTLEVPRGQEMADGKRGEEKVREGKNGEEEVREGKNGEEEVRERKNGEERGREGEREKQKQNEKQNENEGKWGEGIAKGLEEISREELVAYLLEEDSDLIENID